MIKPPISMLAELTHRCPLKCVYCSNPVALHARESEISTNEWRCVFDEAGKLGILQVHLSGGEPASRRDIVEIVQASFDARLYSNLITSGIGITPKRLDAMAEAGLDHIQLSLQGVNADLADRISGYQGGFDRKIKIAKEIKQRGIPLTLNAVMHKQNLDDIDRVLDMAVEMGARRVEIACVQFHGWALLNRKALMPSFEQTEALKKRVAKARTELQGVLAIDFVPPDYHAEYPKACMGGWGSSGIVITPNGKVLPCHAAESISGLEFENVKEMSLAEIWYESRAFNLYRGVDWMEEPCKSCDLKTKDFGGCRCQAMLIAGSASKADPVCRRSPDRPKVDAILSQNNTNIDLSSPLTYREMG